MQTNGLEPTAGHSSPIDGSDRFGDRWGASASGPECGVCRRSDGLFLDRAPVKYLKLVYLFCFESLEVPDGKFYHSKECLASCQSQVRVDITLTPQRKPPLFGFLWSFNFFFSPISFSLN